MSSKYIIKFKKGASDEDVEKFYSELTAQKAEITKKDHKAFLMPRAVATIPDSYVADLQKSIQGGDHDVVEYIEPDGEIKTQGDA